MSILHDRIIWLEVSIYTNLLAWGHIHIVDMIQVQVVESHVDNKLSIEIFGRILK